MISFNKDIVFTILKIAVSVALVLLLVTRIEWDIELFKEIYDKLDVLIFTFSLSGVVLVLGLKSIRWNKLLRAENFKYPYLSAFAAYMVSLMIGLVTPGRIGEIARLYYIRQEGKMDFFHSFKTIVTDRIFDFALLIWFGIAGMLYFYRVLGDFSGLVYMIIVGFFMFILWYTGYLILKSIKSRKTIIVFFTESWNEMFHLKMLAPWILTVAAYILSYSTVFLIFLSIGIKLSIIDIAFVLSLMSLVTLIPITLAGFGTREVSLIYLLGFYGIGPEEAIVFSLLQFIAFFLWGGLIGFVFWIRNPLKLSLILEDSKKILNYIKPHREEAKPGNNK